MNYKLKPKGSIWKLTFPFAHNNYTTIGSTIYYPAAYPPSGSIIAHEKVHILQQQKYGLFVFILRYLFCLPFFYNSFRYRMEWEAYRTGSQLSADETADILRSQTYGWLLNRRLD